MSILFPNKLSSLFFNDGEISWANVDSVAKFDKKAFEDLQFFMDAYCYCGVSEDSGFIHVF